MGFDRATDLLFYPDSKRKTESKLSNGYSQFRVFLM